MKYQLGDIAEFINGDRGKNYPSQEEISEKGDVPFVNAGLLENDSIDFTNMNYISNEKYEMLNSGKFKENDILYCLRGSLGKKALVKKNEYGAIASSLVIIRPNEKIATGRYLLKALESPGIMKQQAMANNGSSQPNLSASSVKNYYVTIPSLPEQIAVTNTLERVSHLFTLRHQQLEKLDLLVKSRFVEMFGDINNTMNYAGIALGDICNTISGGTPTTKNPDYYKGKIPWISTVSLGPNFINGSNAKGYITEEAINNSATHLIPANNILFGTRVGVGKSSINTEPMCTNQDINAIVDIDESKFNKLYIKHTLDRYLPYFNSIKKGATILGITTEDLKRVKIPNAPLSLQNQFADFVQRVDKSKFAIKKSLEKLELLKKKLMQDYFG